MAPSEQPQKQTATPTQADRQPLYMRMYFRAHLTDLVQSIGYQEWTIPQALERLQPLFKRHGKQVIQRAGDEVLQVDRTQNPPVVCLTEEARKLAVGLLGRPPAAGDIEERKATDEPAVQQTQESSVLPAAKVKRVEVLNQFADWLVIQREDHTVVDAKERSHRTDADLRFVDFIVRNGDRQLLLAVRRSLKAAERQSLLDAECACGEGTTAVRIWPDEGPSGWVWRKHRLSREKEAPEIDPSPAA